jgi:hypothetical protein
MFMATVEQKRMFCEALGIRVDQVSVERLPHPEKRAHTIWKVSHPLFGDGAGMSEAEAWQKFFNAAEKKPALPTRCQALKKNGMPCQNAPQAGQRFCGPHLGGGAGTAPKKSH